MTRPPAPLFADHHGVFTRAQALAAGHDDAHLRAMLRNGTWHRIRRGTYVDKAAYSAQDWVGRHRMLAHAVALHMGANVVVSHASSAVLHGLTNQDFDLSRLHVTRTDAGAGRVEPDIHHHIGELPAGDVVTVDDLTLVVPARAVFEVACTSSLEVSVAAADEALRAGLVTEQELRARVDGNRQWQGARNAGAVLALADGRSESIGESRTRLLLHELGLPTPELQHVVVDEARRFVARVDFFFPEHATILEFDGKVKYGAYGTDPVSAVFQEKRREDRLRELGFQVVRIVWSDLFRPAELRTRVLQAFARAARCNRPAK